MFKFNGKEININVDLVIGEGDEAITHPAANLQIASFRAELGITDEPAPARADDRFYENGNPETPKDLSILLAQAVEQNKRTAAGLFAPTDPLVVRLNDPTSGKALPLDVFDYRKGVREACDANEAAILAIKSVPDLAAFVPVWPKTAEQLAREQQL